MNGAELFARGYDLIPTNSDITLLRDGALAAVAAHREMED